MPCSAGSIPVMNVDHATGLCGGMVVSRRLKSPLRRRRSRFGSTVQWAATNFGSMPSMPRTMTFLPFACEPEAPQPALSAATRMRKNVGDVLRVTENRGPFHPCRRLDAEQFECRRRHVFDTRIFRVDLTVGKQ